MNKYIPPEQQNLEQSPAALEFSSPLESCWGGDALSDCPVKSWEARGERRPAPGLLQVGPAQPCLLRLLLWRQMVSQSAAENQTTNKDEGSGGRGQLGTEGAAHFNLAFRDTDQWGTPPLYLTCSHILTRVMALVFSGETHFLRRSLMFYCRGAEALSDLSPPPRAAQGPRHRAALLGSGAPALAVEEPPLPSPHSSL
ncbi:unnamed protein product [Pleuronectes platessa]|uniref:Uncharacterized protein n=1 Tax=Pleuronectes platessa TaxID=8262 RepID=A0A9N7TV87_PLEPL|nr:unnamed protein product [Pleuronectes platessa]